MGRRGDGETELALYPPDGSGDTGTNSLLAPLPLCMEHSLFTKGPSVTVMCVHSPPQRHPGRQTGPAAPLFWPGPLSCAE